MRPYSPEISVVMSVYNGSRYLRESVESILYQEGVDFEFIIVNDGSTDATGEILSEYASRYDRIRIIEQENSGLTRALIRACKEAKGKYIARQDADDISMPGRLLQLQELIESDNNILFVSSWGQNIGPNGELLGTIERPSNPEKATRLVLDEKTGPPGHGSVMFSRDAYELVGGYRHVFYYAQDWDLWLRFAQRGKVSYVPEVLYKYRYWSANISSIQGDLQKQFGKIGRHCLAARRCGESEDLYLSMAEELSGRITNHKQKRGNHHPQISRTYYFIASGMEKQGNKKAIFYFLKAVKYHPLHVRAWIRLILSIINSLLIHR